MLLRRGSFLFVSPRILGTSEHHERTAKISNDGTYANSTRECNYLQRLLSHQIMDIRVLPLYRQTYCDAFASMVEAYRFPTDISEQLGIPAY